MIFHLFKFDFLRTRGVIFGWLALIALHCSLAVWPMHVSGEGVRTAYLALKGTIPVLEALLLVVIVPQIVHSQPLVGSNAFWFSRPIYRNDLIASKALTMAALVFLPIFAEVCVFAASGVVARDSALAALELTMNHISMVLTLATIAVITQDFARFALIGAIAIVFFILVGLGASWIELSRGVGQGRDPIELYYVRSRAIVVALASLPISAAIVAYQYRTRRTAVTATLAIAACLLSLCADMLPWHVNVFGPPATEKSSLEISPEGLVATVRLLPISDLVVFKSAANADKSVAAQFTTSGLPDSEVSFPIGAKLEVHEPDGSVAPVTPMANINGAVQPEQNAGAISAALGGVRVVNSSATPFSTADILKMDGKTYASLAGSMLRIDGDVHMEIGRYRVVYELPVVAGAKWKEGSNQEVIAGFLREGAGVRLLLDIQSMHFLLFSAPSETTSTLRLSGMGGKTVYLLCNRKRNEAVLQKRGGVSIADAVSTMFQAANQMEEISASLAFGPEPYRLTPDLTDEWLADATLVRLELEPVGYVHLPVDLKNVVLNAPNNFSVPPRPRAAFDASTYARVTLPPNPTKAQVREYVDDLLALSQGNVYAGPLIEKLKAVGHENIDVLLDVLAASQRTQFEGLVEQAITSLATASDKAAILAALPENHALAEVVVKFHWADEAKPIFIKELSDDKESTLSRAWIEAVVSFKDPSTYPALEAYLVRTPNRQMTYNLIRKLPGIDLAETVDKAWAQAKLEGRSEMRNCAGFASLYGHVDALGTLIDGLRAPGEGVERAATLARRVTSVPGSVQDLVAWYDANASKLVFDKDDHKYVVAGEKMTPKAQAISAAWLATGLVRLPDTADVKKRRRTGVSQADLALELGISQSLVSQVLKGAKEYCSPGLYETIWTLARKRQYCGRGLWKRTRPA